MYLQRLLSKILYTRSTGSHLRQQCPISQPFLLNSDISRLVRRGMHVAVVGFVLFSLGRELGLDGANVAEAAGVEDDGDLFNAETSRVLLVLEGHLALVER